MLARQSFDEKASAELICVEKCARGREGTQRSGQFCRRNVQALDSRAYYIYFDSRKGPNLAAERHDLERVRCVSKPSNTADVLQIPVVDDLSNGEYLSGTQA